MTRLFYIITGKIIISGSRKARESKTRCDSTVSQAGVVFSEGVVKAASVSWILGVCVQSSSETERKHQQHLNVSPAVPVICHRACYSFSSERIENGKLRELVSEEDANSRGAVLKLPG